MIVGQDYALGWETADPYDMITLADFQLEACGCTKPVPSWKLLSLWGCLLKIITVKIKCYCWFFSYYYYHNKSGRQFFAVPFSSYSLLRIIWHKHFFLPFCPAFTSVLPIHYILFLRYLYRLHSKPRGCFWLLYFSAIVVGSALCLGVIL